MYNTEKTLCDYTKGRSFYGISFAVAGQAKYRLAGGDEILVKGGDVVLLSSEARYKVLTGGDYHHFTVNFTVGEAILNQYLDPRGVSVQSSSNPKLHLELFSRICSVWREKRFGFELNALSVLYMIVAEYFRELHFRSTNDFAHQRLLPAKEYIDAHCTEEMNIELLARMTSMSKTNFRREFSRIYGDSPIHYRDMQRVAHAKDALASGFYTVAEVANICGFSDVSYFSRFFKKHTGMAPAEFKSCW